MGGVAKDPIVDALQVARAEQAARVEQDDPVTGTTYPTGTTRLFVDLNQATLLLNKDT